MSTPGSPADTTLRIERTLAAPRETVWAAWTRPEALSRWFGPTPEYTCVAHELDVRPGGTYRVELCHSGGNRHVVTGTYREVSAPDRLVFSWRWEKNPERGESRVTVELHDEGGRTRLVLLHELFPGVEVRDGHRAGWEGGLDHLQAVLSA